MAPLPISMPRPAAQLSLCLSVSPQISDLSGWLGWDQTWSCVCCPALSSSQCLQGILLWLGLGRPARGYFVFLPTPTMTRDSGHWDPLLSIQAQSTEALCLIELTLWTPGLGGRQETRRKGREIIIEKVEGTLGSQVSEEAAIRTR